MIRESRISIIASIYAIILFIVFGIVFGPIYIIWTALGAVPVIVNFTIMIIVGSKTKNKVFFAVAILIKMIVFTACIFLTYHFSEGDTLALITLASGFTTIVAGIMTYYLIPIFKKERKK